MKFFLRIANSAPEHLELWEIDDDETEAHLFGFEGPHIDYNVKANAEESVWQAFKRLHPSATHQFHRTVLSPGEYYPRIARPIKYNWTEIPPWTPANKLQKDNIAVAASQLSVLTQQLDRVCRVVQPTEETFAAFGHDMRNLLILACTEVESHWKGVLRANGVSKDKLTTLDYYQLRDAMKLHEYSISFPKYPWVKPIAPFAAWEFCRPSQSLQWYDAYNLVKHSRETCFHRATLRCAFEAVSACAIMMDAQFGWRIGSSIERFFHLSDKPSWPLEEIYLHPPEPSENRWVPVSFNFYSGSA